MALIQGPLVADGSGKVGGFVIFRSRGGLAIRAKVTPLNPNTPNQNFVRTSMSNLVNRWINSLSSAERDLWKVYADNVPLTGPLGFPRTVSGLNMYVRGNIGRAQAAGLARADVAPVIFDTGDFTPFTLPTAGVGTAIGAAFTNTDDWANEDGASALFYVSSPKNPTVLFYRGPYQFAGQVDGDALLPPASPAVITSPFLQSAGQKVFIRIVITRADGRLSTEQFLEAIVA